MLRLGAVGSGTIGHGKAGLVWQGGVRSVEVGHGEARLGRCGTALSG